MFHGKNVSHSPSVRTRRCNTSALRARLQLLRQLALSFQAGQSTPVALRPSVILTQDLRHSRPSDRGCNQVSYLLLLSSSGTNIKYTYQGPLVLAITMLFTPSTKFENDILFDMIRQA